MWTRDLAALDLPALGPQAGAMSREHTVSRIAPGLVVVAGGKFTTYRVMAAQAVDEAASQLGRAVPPSCTDRVPLVGADGFLALWNRRHELADAGRHRSRAAPVPGRW